MARSATTAKSPAPPGVRLQRVLADAGVAARRACEELIEQGHVRVNGVVVRRLPAFVDPDNDRIEVDGRPVRVSHRRLCIMVHKPERTLVADEDASGRPTVTSIVDHPSGERLFPVGRLDFDSTGLVLLMNDGELANRLTHPRYGMAKTYHVVVRGPVDESAVDAIRHKAVLAARRDDADRGVARRASEAPEVRIVKREPGRTTLEVTLREARNRQLRDVLKHLGMPVKKLTRVGIGPLRLSGLAVGRWRELTRDEVRALRDAAFPARTTRGSPKKKAPPAANAPARPPARPPARNPARPSARRPS
ncbi:MAG: pseudouridine synthase [Planctomycetota bacterium]|nr:pseudouridine synthase [Planctomycetota bacterium]